MKLSKKYWIAILCKVIVILSTLFISIFINRGLGVEVKGEYAYIINMVEMLYIFAGVGLGQSYSTFKREEGSNNRNIFILLSVAQGILVLIIGGILCNIVKINYGIIITILTALAVVRANVTVIAVIEDSIKRNIIATAINVFYLLLLIILYVMQKCDFKTVIICYGLNEIIRSIVFMYSYKMSPRLENVSFNKLKKIYSIGLITMIVTLLISVNYSMDTIMLNHMTDNYNVGIYSVAVTFSNMFLLIPDAFKEVLF
ncbi:MAG: oligosaccharide flippase family protein, partial [Clostridiaceae bacterium]|nr:oligosaccharide flippase family protein [Clostridiaceae bacterium]